MEITEEMRKIAAEFRRQAVEAGYADNAEGHLAYARWLFAQEKPPCQ